MEKLESLGSQAGVRSLEGRTPVHVAAEQVFLSFGTGHPSVLIMHSFRHCPGLVLPIMSIDPVEQSGGRACKVNHHLLAFCMNAGSASQRGFHEPFVNSFRLASLVCMGHAKVVTASA